MGSNPTPRAFPYHHRQLRIEPPRLAVERSIGSNYYAFYIPSANVTKVNVMNVMNGEGSFCYEGSPNPPG